MGTKANPGPFDCYAAAEPNEPIFILKSTDELAPGIITEWARQYINSKGGLTRMTEEQIAKAQNAFNIADDMKAWKASRDAGWEPTVVYEPGQVIIDTDGVPQVIGQVHHGGAHA